MKVFFTTLVCVLTILLVNVESRHLKSNKECEHEALDPNPEDCGSFLQCVHGVYYTMPCPEGLHWNNKDKICDWPEFAECSSSSSPDNGNGNGNTQSTTTTTEKESLTTEEEVIVTTNEPSSSTEVNEEEDDGDDDNDDNVVIECEDNTYEQNLDLDNAEGDCGSYLKCVNGSYVEENCPEGLHWNDELKICDFPEYANCPFNSATTESESESESQSSTEQVTKTTILEITSTTSHGDGNENEEGECKHEALDPNPEDCGSFLQCVHGVYYTMPCPEGLHWNNKEKICDWPEFAECEGSNSSQSTDEPLTESPATEVTTTKKPVTGNECEHEALDPNPEDCGSFLQCVHGIYYTMPCPEGLHWNNKEKICDWPELADCPLISTQAPTEGTTTIKTTTTEKEPEVSIPTTTTEKPVTGNECEHEALDPNPEDCGSFLQCVHGIYYTMPCPEGLHWNNKEKICDWPELAECEGSNSSQSTDEPLTEPPVTEVTTITTTKKPVTGNECEHEALDPNPEDCGSFLQCVHGIYYTMPCPEGLHWNNKDKICDWPELADCPLISTQAPTEGTTTIKTTTEKEPEVTTPTTTTEMPVTGNECEHEALDPNPDDCGSFLQCVHGIYYTMPCPDGLHWNNKEKICDWPELADCPLISTQAPTEETTTIKTTTEKEPEVSTPTTTEKPVTGNECEHEALDPNPEDCGSFLQCVHGIYYTMPCPEGLHWNNKDKICDWPELADCPLISTQVPTEGTTTDAPSTEPATETTAKEENTTTTEKPVTGNECEHEALDPNPEDCGSFLQCVHGIYYTMPCPEGLHWNNKDKICDWPELADCPLISTQVPTEETTTNEPLTEPATESTTTEKENNTTTEKPVTGNECEHEALDPNPEDCGSFLQCVHGIYYTMPCPEGLHWNNKDKICDWPELADCPLISTQAPTEQTTTDKPLTEPVTETTLKEENITTTEKPVTGSECEHEALDPNPEDCGSFLQCVHGIYYTMPCPEGLHWNNKEKICDWPHNTECPLNPTEPPTEDTTTIKTTTEKEPEVTTPTTTTEKPVTGNECEHEALDPNPEDCGSFLQCVHGIYYTMPCPEGLHWNNKEKICDWPHNTECPLNPTEPPTEETTTIKTTTEKEPEVTTPTTTTEKPITGNGCEHEALDPNPEDCGSFLQCVHGTYYVMPCPEGLHWNNKEKICDWPHNTECSSTNSTTNKPSEEEEDEGESEGCIHEALDPNPEDCGSFLQCVHGTYYVMPCPEGLHWNNKEKICDWPHNTECPSLNP